MDLTAAVAYACKVCSVPFISLERTNGHGVMLNPNADCLSLEAVSSLNQAFADKPLTLNQAKKAAYVGLEKLNHKNLLEWRIYNPSATSTIWPASNDGLKVLFLPSSRSEIEGHNCWQSGWDDVTIAFDRLLEQLNITSNQCVLRCHPGWAQKIGQVYVSKSEPHFSSWAKKSGVHCISSTDARDTYDLMKDSDLVVVNGSSVAFEAGLLGKQIICLGAASYQGSEIAIEIKNDNEWYKLSKLFYSKREDIIRKALRSIFVSYWRFPQFVNHVRARSTFDYEFFLGGDADRILNMFSTNQVVPDDHEFAIDGSAEDEVINSMIRSNWEIISEWEEEESNLEPIQINRRLYLRWINPVRKIFPRGDA